MKPRLLCILHKSPPMHGAAKVGDFIGESKKIKETFDCRFITIKSSDTIGDIGKVNFKKLYLVAELYFKIFFALFMIRPDKIYFTASTSGIAFFRDVLLSTLWKIYRFFVDVDIFYHYHTKGIDRFIGDSTIKLKLVNFFLKDINVILLSPILKRDLIKVSVCKKIFFLPNGIGDSINSVDFDNYIKNKYRNIEVIHSLYLAHMMKDKGYWEVLQLAKSTKNKNIHFHFAGSWQNKNDEIEFFDFIRQYKLEKNITYHGFVSGDKKKMLFELSHVLLYPSKNDAFPLTILESLSYGVPVLATNEGSIPYMLNDKCGIVIENANDLEENFKKIIDNYLNMQVAFKCRERYLNNFSLNTFENNLQKLLKGQL